MMDFIIEGIYLLAQSIFIGRAIYHANASRKEGRSITPIFYWVLTLIANALIGVYGYFLGSWSMPFFGVVASAPPFYHIWIELKRKEAIK